MRTDRYSIAALPRLLRDSFQRITERADDQARAAGLSVEALPGGVRRYRDPRLDELAARRAVRRSGPYVEVRSGEARDVEAGVWSAPTLVTTGGAGWSR